MSKTKHVCIAGATGFVGIELIKLLVKHPNFKIKYPWYFQFPILIND